MTDPIEMTSMTKEQLAEFLGITEAQAALMLTWADGRTDVIVNGRPVEPKTLSEMFQEEPS